MQRLRQRVLLSIVLVLAAAAALSLYALVRESAHLLTVAFLDVGQGDAIYIESPTGTQIVVDGGPNSALLRELGRVMPLYDRSLDAIVVTNPDADHFSGFIDLLSRYKVGIELEPGTEKHTVTYQTLENTLREKGVKQIIARRGMVFNLGGGAHLDVLYPDKDVSTYTPNDGSIVMRLVYGSTNILLMGDATAKVESRLLAIASSTSYKTDILKLGHHGSKTSSSQAWLAAASPAYAIISAGLKNRYGLPSPVVTERLASDSIPTLETFRDGTLIFESDGKNFVRK